VLRDLKPVFGTTAGRPFVFASTGTGMWEAALTNTLAPGDRVLAARFGQFSHLFIDTAERLGLKVDVIDLEWARRSTRRGSPKRSSPTPRTRSARCSSSTTRPRPV
jgi:aspartate aminotransferase-like enzyme